MEINILHLYYDLLNLYGESGNIKALKSYFETQNIKVNIIFKTISDEINLDKIDLVYIGAGTMNNQSIALNHMIKFKDEFTKYIENNGYIISTGNSIELFGEKIDNKKALGIFKYEAINEDIRIIDDALFKCDLINDYVIGFQNQDRCIKNMKEHLFDVVKGTGSYIKSKHEGINYRNFYGTYLIGPLLVRNPKLLEYICNKIIKEKYENFDIKNNQLFFEKKAYDNFMKLHYNEYIK